MRERRTSLVRTTQRRRPATRPLHVARDERGEAITLSEAERSTHLHVFGNSGSGKSRFLEHLIVQDIQAGRGVCLIDPHGTLVERLKLYLAQNRRLGARVEIMQPARRDWTFGFDPLALGTDDPFQREFSVQAIVTAIAQAWGGEDHDRTPLLERNLTMLLGALCDLGLSLPDAPHFLASYDSEGAREHYIRQIGNPELRAQWEEAASLRPAAFTERFQSTANRLNRFLNSPIITPMLRAGKEGLDTRALMDSSGVLLVDLSESDRSLHVQQARLLGTLLVNDFMLKARGRSADAAPFHLYIDECHHYLTSDIKDILFEARKFGLHLTLSHQDLGQLREKGDSMFDAVMSGAQTKVVFQLGKFADAKTVAEERMHYEIDYQRVKEQLTHTEVIGHEIIYLHSEGHSRGTSSSRGEVDTTSTTTTRSGSTSIGSSYGTGGSSSTTEGETFDTDDEVVSTNTASTEGESWSESHSRISVESYGDSETVTRTRSWNEGQSQSQSANRSESLKPVLAVRARQTYSLDEQIHAQARELATLPRRHAVLMRLPDSDTPLTRFRTEDVKEFGGHRAQRSTERFEQAVFERSEFARPRAEVEEPEENHWQEGAESFPEHRSTTDRLQPQQEPPDW